MLTPLMKSAVLTAVLALVSTVAQATVIDFEGLVPATSYHGYAAGTSFSPASGYTLAVNSASSYLYGNAFLTTNFANDGSAILRIYQGGNITLTSTTGSLFTVNGIDLDNYYYNGTATFNTRAILTGKFADGTTISTSYDLSHNNTLPGNDFTTELLTGFTGLKSFTVAALGSSLAVDNIVVSAAAAATTNVPEPASLAILGLGLAGIAAVRHRKSA